MTTIDIKKQGERIVALNASGHSGYAESGQDIVCAGISSIIQTAILGIKNLYKIDILKSINEESGELAMELPNELDEKKDKEIQVILGTMLVGLNDLAQSYPQNITIKEI